MAPPSLPPEVLSRIIAFLYMSQDHHSLSLLRLANTTFDDLATAALFRDLRPRSEEQWVGLVRVFRGWKRAAEAVTEASNATSAHPPETNPDPRWHRDVQGRLHRGAQSPPETGLSSWQHRAARLWTVGVVHSIDLTLLHARKRSDPIIITDTDELAMSCILSMKLTAFASLHRSHPLLTSYLLACPRLTTLVATDSLLRTLGALISRLSSLHLIQLPQPLQSQRDRTTRADLALITGANPTRLRKLRLDVFNIALPDALLRNLPDLEHLHTPSLTPSQLERLFDTSPRLSAITGRHRVPNSKDELAARSILLHHAGRLITLEMGLDRAFPPCLADIASHTALTHLHLLPHGVFFQSADADGTPFRSLPPTLVSLHLDMHANTARPPSPSDMSVFLRSAPRLRTLTLRFPSTPSSPALRDVLGSVRDSRLSSLEVLVAESRSFSKTAPTLSSECATFLSHCSSHTPSLHTLAVSPSYATSAVESRHSVWRRGALDPHAAPLGKTGWALLSGWRSVVPDMLGGPGDVVVMTWGAGGEEDGAARAAVVHWVEEKAAKAESAAEGREGVASQDGEACNQYKKSSRSRHSLLPASGGTADEPWEFTSRRRRPSSGNGPTTARKLAFG
ncbi:hypothetical protein M427DRAFT_58832 [Gonapodya prolifera JEL478]|uniref:F-box domain-containing protein n=1 Tax=Gonapodya prolifera (strain JEL478) TaxID=1344416 RepID=A0A139A983_GONPJ|nr:hypothetical protein M427DRAFT_58832 [Gonapodya prolifera JEL478]|eukprot:KXS13307.1 hypothetical protein M427DRAFT_58832 [Gonapodya prolifera JEL478]